MKLFKVYAVAMLSALTMVAYAAPTATAKISVKSASGNGNDSFILMEAADGTPEFVDGQDIHKLKNASNDYSINLYAVNGTDEMSTYYSNTLEELALVFESNKTETDYTFKFSNVIGTVKLFDAVENKEISLVNGETYAFTVEANKTIADRFIINHTAPATPKALIEGSTLTITGFAGKKVKVEDANGATIVDEKTLASDNEPINLDGQPAGRYVLILDGDKYQFDVRIPEIPSANYHVVVAQP